MLQFLNPSLLVGLAAVALPVIVHLLSRRNHDVVEWGAMQFLDLSRRARRRLRLEQLLLLLTRTAAITLLVLALARPSLSVNWLRPFSTQNRDVVLILDSSYSMSWEGGRQTPHSAALDWAFNFLEHLQPGDTVSLLDARHRPRHVIDAGTRDLDHVRRELGQLPAPSGSSNISQALFDALELLRSAGNPARDVVILSDEQAAAWDADNHDAWSRCAALAVEQSVRPRVWALNLSSDAASERINFSIEPPRPSRDAPIAGVPLQIRARVTAAGIERATTKRVSLHVDGLRLSEQTQSVELNPDAQADVDFEYVPRSAGSHVISVVVDGKDHLPYDDRAHLALPVSDALRVLLLDGDLRTDPTESETFFAAAALTPAANAAPWVRTQVLSPDRLDSHALQQAAVVVLANVASLTARQSNSLAEYVAHGGGLLIAPGHQVDAQNYNAFLAGLSSRPHAVDLVSIQTEPDQSQNGFSIARESLAAPWLDSFLNDDTELTTTRFTRYWRVALSHTASDAGSPAAALDLGPSARVLARFHTGDPFLVEMRSGPGRVLLMTAPLDADWGSLPTKADYVPFLHEMLFHLARLQSQRNVEAGEPLQWAVPRDFPVGDFAFYGPHQQPFAVERAGDDLLPIAQLSDTTLPGIYTLRHRDPARGETDRAEQFVVRELPTESDLTPLDELARKALAQQLGIVFVDAPQDLLTRLLAGDARFEIGNLLLLLCLLLLVAETLLTRRLVQGGDVEQPSTHEAPSSFTAEPSVPRAPAATHALQ